MESDDDLIAQVRQFITPTNSHRVCTWVHRYEMSLPGSRCQLSYEKLLRDFLYWNRRQAAINQRAETEQRRFASLAAITAELKHRIGTFLT
jgi:hypothetical protein